MVYPLYVRTHAQQVFEVKLTPIPPLLQLVGFYENAARGWEVEPSPAAEELLAAAWGGFCERAVGQEMFDQAVERMLAKRAADRSGLTARWDSNLKLHGREAVHRWV